MLVIAQALGGALSTTTRSSGGAIYTFRFFDRYIASRMMDILEYIKKNKIRVIEFSMKPGQAYSDQHHKPEAKKYFKAPGSRKNWKRFYVSVHEWRRVRSVEEINFL